MTGSTVIPIILVGRFLRDGFGIISYGSSEIILLDASDATKVIEFCDIRIQPQCFCSIAFCSLPSPEQANTISERYEGYLSALEQNKIPFSESMVYIKKDMTFEEFGDYVVENLSSTALFASTDELGLILMKKFALSSKHPAIIGFDNTVLSSSLNMASINQNFYEMGRTAARLLYERIINPNKSYEHIYIPVSLEERAPLTRPADI